MIWLAWRLMRTPVLTAVGTIAALTGALIALRHSAVGFMADHGIAGCLWPDDGECSRLAFNALNEEYSSVRTLLAFILLALPPLVGMLVGGPMFAREIESGTHTFALTQSVSRIRWWASKLLVGAGPVLLAVTGLGLVGAWAMEPLAYLINGRIKAPAFETQGLAIIGYTVLALAIGSTAGLLLRNTLGAMVVTVVLYMVLVISVANLARPVYLEPQVNTESVAAFGDPASNRVPEGAWPVGGGYLGPDGEEVAFRPSEDCLDEACLRANGIETIYAEVQPDSRFWALQWIEAALFTGIALILTAVGVWAVRRRLH